MAQLVDEGKSAILIADSIARKIYYRDRTKGRFIDEVENIASEWDSAVAVNDIDCMKRAADAAKNLANDLSQYRIYKFQLSDDGDTQTTVGVEFVARSIPEAVSRLLGWAPDLDYFVFKGVADL